MDAGIEERLGGGRGSPRICGAPWAVNTDWVMARFLSVVPPPPSSASAVLRKERSAHRTVGLRWGACGLGLEGPVSRRESPPGPGKLQREGVLVKRKSVVPFAGDAGNRACFGGDRERGLGAEGRPQARGGRRQSTRSPRRPDAGMNGARGRLRSLRRLIRRTGRNHSTVECLTPEPFVFDTGALVLPRRAGAFRNTPAGSSTRPACAPSSTPCSLVDQAERCTQACETGPLVTSDEPPPPRGESARPRTSFRPARLRRPVTPSRSSPSPSSPASPPPPPARDAGRSAGRFAPTSPSSSFTTALNWLGPLRAAPSLEAPPGSPRIACRSPDARTSGARASPHPGARADSTRCAERLLSSR